jgi:transketolase
MASALARKHIRNPEHTIIRFDREKFPSIYENKDDSFTGGFTELKSGRDLTLLATSSMVHQAFKVANELSLKGIDAGIIDLYRIKPLDEEHLIPLIASIDRLVTIEENFLEGGIGSIIAGVILDRDLNIKLKRFGIPATYFSQGGGREGLRRLAGLDVDTITSSILKWMEK